MHDNAPGGNVNGGFASSTPGMPTGSGDTATHAIVSAVEQQLTKYFSAMAARADAVQHAGEAGRAEIVTHFQQQIDDLRSELDRSQQANGNYERALQAALEERLTEFAANQHWRFNEVEGRLERVADDVSLTFPAQIESATAPLQQRFEHVTELMANRIEELQKAARRFDEQSSALVQHVNDTSTTLSKRLDESSRATNSHLDERTLSLSQRVDESMGVMRQHVAEQAAAFGRRIEDNDSRVIDRMLAMEERMNDHTGVRLAGVEATLGRISGGIDEAIVALSQRVIDLESRHVDVVRQLEELSVEVDKIDEDALNQLREQMSSAVGEAMLVRIELERVASSTGEQFDTVNLRIAEVAATLADTVMDVSTAVQLDRLEEIERALIELDPEQFVRRGEPLVSTPSLPGNGGVSPAPATTEADANSTESSLSSW